MEEKHAHLAGHFQIRQLAVHGLPWEVMPADESTGAMETARFCRLIVESLTDLDDNILALLDTDALPRGYSMMEILWEASEGKNQLAF
jgi:phage gp29-like protein